MYNQTNELDNNDEIVRLVYRRERFFANSSNTALVVFAEFKRTIRKSAVEKLFPNSIFLSPSARENVNSCLHYFTFFHESVVSGPWHRGFTESDITFPAPRSEAIALDDVYASQLTVLENAFDSGLTKYEAFKLYPSIFAKFPDFWDIIPQKIRPTARLKKNKK